jgi:microsomal dipeptidase-like Zn-dependent dipeptidase
MDFGRWLLFSLCLSTAVGCSSLVDRHANLVEPDEPYEVSAEGRAFHETLRVVDLHSDALLLGRDILKRWDRGHTDVPRLIEGNVWVQCFATVTKAPIGLALEGPDQAGIEADSTDLISLLASLDGWPPETREGPEKLYQRALYEARRLERAERCSGGKIRILRNREDLREYLAERAANRDIVAGILCIEGAQVLHGDLEKLDRLYDAGFRMLGLVHFFDNEVGGSANGVERGGLTEFGKSVIRRMGELRMMVDLAHASEALITDVLAEVEQLPNPPPVLVSHTGTYDSKPYSVRHLKDHQIVSIIEAGGLVGLGFFMGEKHGMTVVGYARLTAHVAGLAPDAASHLALGSDFDGLLTVPVDAADLNRVTDAMLRLEDEGGSHVFTPDQVRGILGENALHFLDEALPPRADSD